MGTADSVVDVREQLDELTFAVTTQTFIIFAIAVFLWLTFRLKKASFPQAEHLPT